MSHRTLPAAPAPNALVLVRPKLRRRDLEFLPAALEILETPPSPIRMTMLLTICGMMTAALAWSSVSRIDIVAVARGATRPIGQSKTVEPLETGRVQAINVAEGQQVHAGDVLLQLDPTEAKAEAEGAWADYVSFNAEVLRRAAAIRAIGKPGPIEVPEVVWPHDVPWDIAAREAAVLVRDLDEVTAQLDALSAQKAEKAAQRDRLQGTLGIEGRLVATLQQRVDMRDELLGLSSGSKASVIDALQTLQSEQTTLASNQGLLAEANAAFQTLDRDSAKVRTHFTSENAQKQADAERHRDEALQRYTKASAVLEHRTLRSPIDGIVQGLAVHAVGQVVATGQQTMRVVPDHLPLEIQAYVDNKDIGFVRNGQEVSLKFESFPFGRYGTASGRIIHVSPDSIPESVAQRSLSDSVPPAKRAAAADDPSTSVDLVYPVTIKPDADTFVADGRPLPLGPGMSVSVEIKTGSRRLIEYILSPLVTAKSEIMRER